MSYQKQKLCYGCATFISFCLFAFGLIFGLLMQNKIDSSLKEISSICGLNSPNYDTWQRNNQSDAPAKYKKYVGFNVTNALEYITTKDVKLQLDARGVYAMRQYDFKFNVSFSSDNSQVSYKTWERYELDHSQSCSTCQSTDLFTNMNPAFLRLLTRTGSELVLGLGMSSVNLAYGGIPRCTEDNIKHSLDPRISCSVDGSDTQCCCDIKLSSSQPNSCGARAASILGLFAGYDNGVSLPNGFSSPLFITKTVHEAAYGYPSAIVGLVAGLQFAQNLTAYSTLFNAMASYTQLALTVCGFQSKGYAPSVDQLNNPVLQQAAGITCSPIQAAQYWTTDVTINNITAPRCGFIPNGCKCLNAAHGDNGTATLAKPCCTSAGLGCLGKVTGYVSDSLYQTIDQYISQYPEDLTTAATGCGNQKSGEEFYWSVYDYKKEVPLWSQGLRENYQAPTQDDIKNVANFTYSSPVRGGDGTRAKGRGRTSGLFSDQVSDGNPAQDETIVFITQVPRAQTIYNQGSEKYKGILVSRFAPKSYFLNQSVNAQPANIDNGQVGAGTPYSGLQDVSFVSGFPAYVSRPFYLYNEDLLEKGISVTLNGAKVVPNADDHETYLLIEPASGLTLSGHKRLMASFSLYNCSSLTQGCIIGGGAANVFSPNVPPSIIVPQYYMDETASLPDDKADQFKQILQLSLASDCILVVVTIVGGLGWVIGMFFLYKLVTRPRRSLVSQSKQWQEPLVPSK
eukprot:c15693_g1_i1.p1 GENE.c15693_g1_i1~~c15693_g1_i1.p1  ORF type:complete len:738 (-),score=279.31 c15693_g1_i1:154-2367(-)